MITAKKKIISSIVLSCLLLTMVSGCGNNVTVNEENIELLDPVGISTNHVKATKRDLVDASIYQSVVVPDVVEYSFSNDQKFYAYNKLPGEEVASGDVLAYGSTVDIDKQIEDMTKSISDMEAKYDEDMKDLNDALAEAKKTYDYWETIMGIVDSNKVEEGKADFQTWQEQFYKYDSLDRQAWLNMARIEQSIKERSELYTLDHNYQLSLLSNLRKKRNQSSISAAKDGVVVGLSFTAKDTQVTKDNVMMAVADVYRKELKTDFINKSVINKAEEVFAVVKGKRYNVTYEAIESDEYTRLASLLGTVNSTFVIDDPDNEVDFGQFGVIVVVNKRRNDVLCVPQDAVKKDESGEFVYSYIDDEPVRTAVQTGMKDGNYVEIVSGLDEGTDILSDEVIKPGTKTMKIGKGYIGNEFNANGYFYYSETDVVRNKVKYGTTYLEEKCVSRFEQVQKGQVVAKVSVVPDTIEIKRQERLLQRQEEKLAELTKDTDEDSIKANEKAVASTNKQIAEIKKLIAEMKADSATKEIVAPYDGIITDITYAENMDLLFTDQFIFEIARQDSCYLLVEDQGGVLSYGNNVEISFDSYDMTTGQRVTKTSIGKVVTAAPTVFETQDLRAGYSLIQIDPDVVAHELGSLAEMMRMNGWWNQMYFNVKFYSKNMNDILVVPRKAVTVINGSNYVRSKDEAGNVRYVPFISGGADNDNYWVLDGLTEGMEICLE